jgi:FlaA1/EpsC-like NDP-sugar epimerase
MNILKLIRRKSEIFTIDIESHEQELRQIVSESSFLVIGGAGSIGQAVAKEIFKRNPLKLHIVDISENNMVELVRDLRSSYGYIDGDFQTFALDIGSVEYDAFIQADGEYDYVLNLSALKHVRSEKDPFTLMRMIDVNIFNIEKTINQSIEKGSKKYFCVSTDKAANPVNMMGASKRIAEIYVQSLFNSYKFKEPIVYTNGLSYLNENRSNVNTLFITTRFGNVLGSSGSVIPRFKAQIERGGPITVTHPDITRYFMTIPEACRLVLEAGSMGEGGEIFIFDMGKSVKIIELAKKMIRLSGLVPHQDIAIEFSGLRPGEKLYEELLNDLENTMPTHHEKIMVAQVREYHFQTINKHISELIKLSCEYKDRQVVVKMKEIVPEFKSNNSIYEELDILVELPDKSISQP